MKITLLQVIILLIELALIYFLYGLSIPNSEGKEEFYEDDLNNFYEKYVINDHSFPYSYRLNTIHINKIFEIINNDPSKYTHIPEDEIDNLKTLMKITSGEYHELFKTMSIFLAMTLIALFLII